MATHLSWFRPLLGQALAASLTCRRCTGAAGTLDCFYCLYCFQCFCCFFGGLLLF